MTKQRTTLQAVSRRDALRVCLLPAGVVGARWLAGCSSDDAASTTPPAESGSSTQAGSQASSTPPAAGTSAAAGSKASASSSAGSSGAPEAGHAGSAMHAAGSGTGGTSAAGTASAATGGTPAAGAPAAATSGRGGTLATGGNSASAGTGGSAIAMPSGMWATGGTKTMQGGYPDPFAGGNLGSMCVLYPTQTIGPCYAMGPMLREDISDGLGGLPLRLSFLVVKKDCTPVPNASIDIWHSGSQGIYSAYATGTICNPGTDNVMSMMFCRGVQTTNESGQANFSTVFPGWYQGRTIHIHFTVRLNNREAVTSQIYFDDMLVDGILAQGDYKARGKRDTTNKSDGLFSSGGAKPDQVLFSTAQRSDGVLHAWKVLQISG